MPISFCPDKLAWGDVATWLAAVGSLVIGALAWRTAVRSTQIAESAQAISDAHLQEVRREREAQAKVVAAMLSVELSALPAILVNLAERLDRAARVGEIPELDRASHAYHAARELALPLAPSVERLGDRLHTLPDGLAKELGVLSGCLRTLHLCAQKLSEFTEELPKEAGFIYTGGSDRLWAMQDQTLDTIGRSIRAAEGVVAYAGIQGPDLAELRSRLKALQKNHRSQPGRSGPQA